MYTKMGKLIAADPKKSKVTVWFVTIERKPGAELKKAACTIIREMHQVVEMYGVDEVSPDGYHHTHVVWRTANQQHFAKLCKRLQKELNDGWKTESKISVRFYHPRHGDNAENYSSVKKYLTSSDYKVKKIDDEGVEWEASSLELCKMEKDCPRCKKIFRDYTESRTMILIDQYDNKVKRLESWAFLADKTERKAKDHRELVHSAVKPTGSQ